MNSKSENWFIELHLWEQRWYIKNMGKPHSGVAMRFVKTSISHFILWIISISYVKTRTWVCNIWVFAKFARSRLKKKIASSDHWSYLSICRVVYLLVQAYHSSYQIIFIILLIIQGWRRTRAQTKTFPTWRTLSFSWQTSYESAGKLCTFFQPDRSLQKSLSLNLISFSYFQTKHWRKKYFLQCVYVIQFLKTLPTKIFASFSFYRNASWNSPTEKVDFPFVNQPKLWHSQRAEDGLQNSAKTLSPILEISFSVL